MTLEKHIFATPQKTSSLAKTGGLDGLPLAYSYAEPVIENTPYVHKRQGSSYMGKT